MRLIIIPPYQNPVVNWVFIIRALLNDLEKKGQLKGVEVDIDEGHFTESTAESRDEVSRATMSAGLVKKAREYSETGKYDAIVFTGGTDPAFAASRLASKIPVVGALHSCLHVASLIGERCGHINLTASSALAIRHAAESYGLEHKLASVRYVNYSTTHIYKLLGKYKDDWEDRFKDPEIKKILDDIGLGSQRLDMVFMSGSQAQTFATAVQDMTDRILELGPNPLKDKTRQRSDDLSQVEIEEEIDFRGRHPSP